MSLMRSDQIFFPMLLLLLSSFITDVTPSLNVSKLFVCSTRKALLSPAHNSAIKQGSQNAGEVLGKQL